MSLLSKIFGYVPAKERKGISYFLYRIVSIAMIFFLGLLAGICIGDKPFYVTIIVFILLLCAISKSILGIILESFQEIKEKQSTSVEPKTPNNYIEALFFLSRGYEYKKPALLVLAWASTR